MNKRPFVLLGIFAVFAALVIVFVTSQDGSGDAAASGVASQDEEARELFATNCGACHTLGAAGTDGVVGPNLDTTLVPTPPADPAALADSYEGNYTRTLTAVECGLNGRMPKGILQGDQAREVSSFVAAYAGQLSPGAGPSVDTEEVETPPLAEGCPTSTPDSGGSSSGGSDSSGDSASSAASGDDA